MEKKVPKITLPSQLLYASARKYPENTALVIDDKAFSYQQLYLLAARLAASFQQLGLKEGDRVGFLLPNSVEIVLCYYASFMAGAIATPVNLRFDSKMTAEVLEKTSPKIFITTASYYSKVKKLLADSIPCYLVDSPAVSDGLNFDTLIAETVSPLKPKRVAKNKPALIFFTSGTTGLPKGVCHSQESLIQGSLNQLHHIQITDKDKTLVMFPLCLLIGLGSQILPFHYAGATVVVMKEFEAQQALALLLQHQITKIYGFPKLYLELMQAALVVNCKKNQLNFCFSGGEALSSALHQNFKTLFNCEITEGCGMSELQVYCINPPYQEKKPGSIGYPLPPMQMKLLDSQQKKLTKAGQIGEMLVKGKSMTCGYWCNPQLTKKTILKGWFHTGDLAYFDEDGCYWFVCRKVDLIKRGDATVSPLVIESAFYQQKEVKEAAAIGLANAENPNFDKILVYLVLKNSHEKLDLVALKQLVCKTLPPLMQPDHLVLVKQLPYGLTGKIDRKTLKAQQRKLKNS